MQIISASQLLTAAVHAALVAQMARELRLRHADLGCEVSIIHTLTSAGFGVPSIRQLRRKAAEAAREMLTADHGGMH